MLALFALVLAPVPAAPAPPLSQQAARQRPPSALVVLVPRWPADGVPAATMPRLRALADEGAWCLRTRGEDLAAPAAGWASALTGVYRDRHGLVAGPMDPSRLAGVPNLLSQAHAHGLSSQLAMPSSLLPELPAPDDPDAFREFSKRMEFPFGVLGADDPEGLVSGARARARDGLLVVVLDTDDPARLDALVARLLDGPPRDDATPDAELPDDRLVVVAGLRAHDGGRFAPLIVNGPGVVRGRTFPAAQLCDVAAIVARHLGLDLDGLDGRPVAYPLDADGRPLERRGPGAAWMGPPFAELRTELLVDGGGDLRRGFDGLPDPEAAGPAATAPEAALVAWDDPGPMTLLAESALPEPLVGADGNVFANASTSEPAHVVQEVDVLPLRPWFRREALDVLYGWGAARVGDAPGEARLVVECLDDAGAVLARSESIADPDAPPHALALRAQRVAAPTATRRLRVTLELPARGAEGYWVADGLTLEVVPRSDDVAAAEWRPLLTPDSLAEWLPVNVAPETFSAWNGVVRCDGRPTGVLRSPERHRDFVVEFEYLHETHGGNGGFFVWSDPLPAVGVPFTRGVEVQVIEGWETENWTSHGDVFAIWGATLTPDRPHPAGWMRSLPHQRRAFPAGQWNHFRIVGVDGRIQLWVNGQPVTEAWDVVPREGFLCLESEGAPVRYRNLWVRDLPADDAPLPPERRAAADEGFRSIYSGRDLRGFRSAPPEAWRPQDWKLVAAAGAPWLVTERSFDDFELLLDVRLTGEPPVGDDAPAPPDDTVVVPLDRLGLPAEGFHRLRLTHRDGRWTRVLLDGEELHLAAPLPPTPTAGPLALRPPLGAPAEFANLFVRPLAR